MLRHLERKKPTLPPHFHGTAHQGSFPPAPLTFQDVFRSHKPDMVNSSPSGTRTAPFLRFHPQLFPPRRIHSSSLRQRRTERVGLKLTEPSQSGGRAPNKKKAGSASSHGAAAPQNGQRRPSTPTLIPGANAHLHSRSRSAAILIRGAAPWAGVLCPRALREL